jgi:bacteriorhodopsin
MQKGLDIHFAAIDRYLDNLLAMPIILSFLMIERRYLLSRKQSFNLSILEVLVATIFITVVAEILFPLFSKKFTTDWLDVLFYTLGSLIFHLTINQRGKD